MAALPRLTGDTLHRILVEEATAQHDATLDTTLGQNHNEYKNLYGQGGEYYNSLQVAFAGMSPATKQRLFALYPSPQVWAAAGYRSDWKTYPTSWEAWIGTV